MVQRGDRASFLLETRRVLALQPLDRDDTIETRVAGFLHLAHAAGAERRDDFIRTETRAG